MGQTQNILNWDKQRISETETNTEYLNWNKHRISETETNTECQNRKYWFLQTFIQIIEFLYWIGFSAGGKGEIEKDWKLKVICYKSNFPGEIPIMQNMCPMLTNIVTF